jgi:hypothetical protein
MKKKILKVAGIFGAVLVFCLGISCTEVNWFSDEAEIIITNNSTFSGDENVTVYIFGEHGNFSLDQDNIPRNKSKTFNVHSGRYMLRISVGGNHFSYPQDGNTINMTGKVRLQFTGDRLRRTN